MGGSISSHFVGIPGGLLMSLIAFSIVFLVIAGLMCMMMLLKTLAGSLDSAQKAKAASASAAPAAPSATGGTQAAPAVASQDDGELMAVIMAAITAMCGTGTRIVSVAPAQLRVGGSAWRMTGRLQNSEGFAD